MSNLTIRRVIGTALSACRHTAWVAVWTDGTRGVTEIVGEGSPDSKELEKIARAEHRFFLHDGQGVVVSRSRSGLGRYAHGVTLVCGGEKEWRLLVMVLRGDGLGRFTEPEVEELQGAASAIATSVPRPHDGAAHAHTNVRSREYPAFFILNLRYELELSWLPDSMQGVDSVSPDGERMAPVLEETARTLTASWNASDPKSLRHGMAMPRPTIVVRAMPLQGPAGLRIGLIVELLRTRDTIGRAARAFGLTSRELDVLALLLDGRETREVAEILHIAPSTATDHVKRMLLKTNSRNRGELIARALGWQR